MFAGLDAMRHADEAIFRLSRLSRRLAHCPCRSVSLPCLLAQVAGTYSSIAGREGGGRGGSRRNARKRLDESNASLCETVGMDSRNLSVIDKAPGNEQSATLKFSLLFG
jgi:hypothetical protein